MSKLGVRKGAWEKAEDILLRKCIKKYGEGNWHQVPQRAGLNRCRKSCRLRWLNYLRPNIKRGEFKEDEIDLIIRLHKLLGNRWSLIAGRLPGRTANDIKNYWKSHLSKKFVFKEKDDGIPNLQKVEVIKPQPRSFKVMPTRLTNKHVKQQEQHIVHQQLQQQQQQLLLPQQQQQQLLPQQGEHDMPEEHRMPEPLEEGSMWWENLVLDSEEINQDLCASFRNDGLSSSIGEDVEPMGAEEGMVVDGGGVEFDDLVNMNFWILE